jgi:hypothetical protein
MKKYFLFVLVLFSMISCQEDVHFNTPSFQGTKDNVFWRAVQSKATVASNGSLVIEAYTGNEITTLKINATTVKTYFLGIDASNTATYVLNDASGKVTFATGTNVGNGQIVLTEYDAVNHTVSGTFKFNAVNINNNPLFGEELNFQYGVFYKVPVVSPL